MIRRRIHRLSATRPQLLLASVMLLVTACTPPGLPAPIAPTSSAPQPSAPVKDGALIIGMDGTPTGFNLHAIADYSPVSTAVSSLVLPSASVMAADGTLSVNRELLNSASVTSTDPFTVSYSLDRDASWSDGTPITAEDFSFLWQQMITEPGTVDPAGYRLITAIRSLDAGKTVEVEFSAPLADWLTLFSPLLPSHILKDSPGGWAGGLAGGIPVSGNRYKMTDFDTTTGEITLTRNDKYWRAQPGPATVLLRIGTSDSLVGALGHGDVQAVLIRPGVAAVGDLTSSVPVSRRVEVALPASVQLVFNTTTGPTADIGLRRAVAAALDLVALRSDLGGGRSGAARAVTSQISLPTGTAGSELPVTTGNRAAALAALTAAGYSLGGVYQRRNGTVLRLTLAYPSGDTRIDAAARTIQSELGEVGIEIDLVRLDSRTLVVDRLAAGTAELALLTVPRASPDSISAASAFSCPVRSGSGSGSGSGTGAAVPPGQPRSGNLSGLCDPGLDTLLSAGVLGRASSSQRSATDARVWADLPVLPLAQLTEVFAVNSGLAAVAAGAGPGWTYSGPLAGLPTWPSR